LKSVRGEAAEIARCAGDSAAARSAPAPTPAKPAKWVPPVLLATKWEGQDPTGWWMSEKLDGVRAYWDGARLWSRLGNQTHAPDWFLAQLPPGVALDGELWVKRKFFHQTSGMVRRQDKSEAVWRALTFVLFDAPSAPGGFEERLGCLESLGFGPLEEGEPAGGTVRLVRQRRCEGRAQLQALLTETEAAGGEGLMLRKPGSPYEVGRSQTCLKVKSFLDLEAVVIGYVGGEGKYEGMVGALECELEDGTRFTVGTGLKDRERRYDAAPPLGSIVTIHCKELTDARVPREPTFHGVRHDAAFRGQA